MATRTPIRTPGQAFEAYVQGHTDLASAYNTRPNQNQSMASWGSDHWTNKGGKNNENRLTPHSYRYTDSGRRGSNWKTDAEQTQYDIDQAMAGVRGMFANRGGYYNKYKNDVYGLSVRDIQQSYDDAKRKLNFALLRKGTNTGQADVDLTQRLNKTKTESLGSAMRYAQGLVNELKAHDAGLQAKMMGAAGSGALTADGISNYQGQLAQGSVVPWDTGNITWTIPQKMFGTPGGGKRPFDAEDNDVLYSGSVS